MILKLVGVTKELIWGGDRLREEYGKCGGERIAESWELSCHHDGLSVIDGGEFDGMTLERFLAENPDAVGDFSGNDFPLLIKLIDAHDDLSIQVHPNEEYAVKHEGDHGKTEMWYILDCEPDSYIVFGFGEDMTCESFRRSIEDNTLTDKVNIVPVKKGDVFLIRAGTLHAIGKGCLIAEIQQSSNVTYRVYDYGRPRELHIEKALDVTDTTRTVIPKNRSGRVVSDNITELIVCEYFSVYRENISGVGEIHRNDKSFCHVLVLDGTGNITDGNTALDLKKGESFFVTAGTSWKIGGECTVLFTSLTNI